MRFLEEFNVLSNSQHGFRKGRSCETQLTLLLEDLQSNVDRRAQVDMVFLDFSKAFDTVPHKRLLAKLESYGISNQVVSWVRSFLSNWTQHVVVDGIRSSSANDFSGVPQGSVLGPLLFLLYINDMSGVVRSNIRLFADDALIYNIIESDNDCI